MAVIPVYNVLVAPDANIYFKTDTYENVAGKSPSVDEKVTIVVLKDKLSRDEIRHDSFYPIGLSGVITEVNPNGYIVVRTRYRINVQEAVVYKDHDIDLTITKRRDIDDLDRDQYEKTLKELKNEMVRYSDFFQWGQGGRAFIARWNSVSEIAAALSPWMMNNNEERYAILAEDSLTKRTEMMVEMIYENLEMSKVNSEAKTAQEGEYQKIYRESAIKKQMEYLQKELDEMHPENVSDIRKFEIKIEESGMNETAKGEATKVLNRIKQEGQHSAETGMLYDYLDFLTSLSWKKEQAEKIDLEHAEKVLEEDHFGLKKVKERIIQQIAVMDLKKQQTGSILLFVGAPGTGKTSIGQSIARALQREYVRVSLGGVRDEADIRGHRRTYIGAMPGRIMDGIKKSGVSNPVMVLDEVDKLSVSYNGDPASALLEVLDPEQNNTFTDHYMNVPYDLSDVMFICTANTVDTIPEPLLNRMEVIQFQGYSPIEKFEIARQHLIPKAMKLVGLEESQVEITDDALRLVISDYTRESGVRGLKKRMDSLCRAAAVELVKGREDKVVIDMDNLREYLDMHPLRHQKVMETKEPGIVTGLAWTSVGGEILYIETMLTKGSGRVTITGQLGDVMKESAQIAVSLVKHAFPDSVKMLEENDLHIHVPDGSTPKDGPSAGITLTTAIASLVTGCPVDSEIAMTGEVSLRGNVNAIGGLPEKLMAAQRAGVKKVLIPRDNLEDLEDVPEEVKKQLEIVPVDTVADVLELCCIKTDKISVA